MKKYTFFLWLNDKDTKKQIVSTEGAENFVLQYVAGVLWGWTVSLCKWVFQHDDGKIVIENSIKIETLGFKDDEVYKEFAKCLRDEFNQESVLLEVSEVSEYFI